MYGTYKLFRRCVITLDDIYLLLYDGSPLGAFKAREENIWNRKVNRESSTPPSPRTTTFLCPLFPLVSLPSLILRSRQCNVLLSINLSLTWGLRFKLGIGQTRASCFKTRLVLNKRVFLQTSRGGWVRYLHLLRYEAATTARKQISKSQASKPKRTDGVMEGKRKGEEEEEENKNKRKRRRKRRRRIKDKNKKR